MNAPGARSRTVLALLALLLAIVPTRAVHAQEDEWRFLDVWAPWELPVQRGVTSRTWMFGPNATNSFFEPYAESPDGQRLVQYFEKSRMELTHPDGDDTSPWFITNGLLATELISGRLQLGDDTFERRQPAQVNVAGDPDDTRGPTYATFARLLDAPAPDEGASVTQTVDRDGVVADDPALAGYGVSAGVYIPATDHRVASVFWAFIQSEGMIWDMVSDAPVIKPLFPQPWYVIGQPITEAYWATIRVAGTDRDVLTQCFERRCLTFTPDNPTGWQVEMGNIGQHYVQWRYANLPQPTGKIAYVGPPYARTGLGDWGGDIWTVNADGTGRRNVTNSGGWNFELAWSPDARKIAFARMTPDDTGSDLYLINADGTGLLRLTDQPENDELPVWSPDGTRLAYTISGGANPIGRQVATINADGTGQRVLAEGYLPQWSPDGSRIAYQQFINQSTGDAVFVMNADGTDIRQVSKRTGGKRIEQWSPDGSWIGYWDIGDPGTSPRNAIVVVRPDGSDEHRIGNVRTDWGFEWSPDGSKIAFVNGENGDPTIMNADGTNPTSVIHNGISSVFALSWSPDGRFLTFTLGYYYNGNEGDSVMVAHIGHPEWPVRVITHGFYDWVQWSPVT
jgi:Tol biopolymer transport system component